MSAVRDLMPGQVVDNPFGLATFIGRYPHPIPAFRSEGLVMVIWRLSNGEVSLDALLPQQEVGDGQPATDEQLDGQLRAAIRGQRE